MARFKQLTDSQELAQTIQYVQQNLQNVISVTQDKVTINKPIEVVTAQQSGDSSSNLQLVTHADLDSELGDLFTGVSSDFNTLAKIESKINTKLNTSDISVAANQNSGTEIGTITIGSNTTSFKVGELSNLNLTGTPTAPTQAATDSSTSLATTAFVQRSIQQLIGGAPATLDTLYELAEAIDNKADVYDVLTNAIATKQAANTKLTNISNLTLAADKLMYSTGTDSFSTTTLSSFGRSLIDDADAAAARATLGVTNSAGTTSTLGLTKLYTSTGSNTDGAVTQNTFTTTINDMVKSVSYANNVIIITKGDNTTSTITLANNLFYGTCSTAAGTAAKTVTVDSAFNLTTGVQVTVKFTVANTASSPTLNVNSKGAKAIQYRGYAIPAAALSLNSTYTLVYNGSAWEIIGSVLWTN